MSDAHLTPTEHLICENLAARLRLGEACWSFDTRLRSQLNALVDKGLVREVKQWVPEALVALPADALRERFLVAGYGPAAGTAPQDDPEPGPALAVTEARALLEAQGHVVLKAPSYHRLLERKRLAEARQQWAEENAEHARTWAQEAFTEQRRLSDRLTHVYGVARARGATLEELASE